MKLRDWLGTALIGLLVGGILSVPLAGMMLASNNDPLPANESLLSRLYEAYDCWLDDGAKHPLPAGALVTLPGDEPTIVPADVGFGIWIDGDPGRLHAFCLRGPRNVDTRLAGSGS